MATKKIKKSVKKKRVTKKTLKKSTVKKQVKKKLKKTTSAKKKRAVKKKTQPKKAAASKKKVSAKKKTAVKKKTLTKKTTGAKRTAVPTRKKKKTAKKRASQREKIIQKIKFSLLSQKESLLREAEEALNILPGDINFPDMGDQASAETDRNFMLRLRDRERMLLKKIDETIERIENNLYGICTSCDNEIGIRRLEARPVTDLCIECKIRQEEDERISES